MKKLCVAFLLLTCTLLHGNDALKTCFQDSFKCTQRVQLQAKDTISKPVQCFQDKEVEFQIGSINDLTVAAFDKAEKRMNAKVSECQGRCGVAIPIGQNDIGPDGYVISQSGIYCLKEDIIFDPSADNIAAITINADFVILDFSEHLLTQSATSYTAFDNTTAVLINPGSNYVTVRNGTIQRFSNMGIFAKGSTLITTDHRGILIELMRVLECGKALTVPTDRILNQTRSAIGIDSSQDVIVRECLTSLTVGDGVDGIGTQISANVIIKKCVAVDHTGRAFGNGISITNGNDVLLEKCIAQRVSSVISQVAGIVVDQSANVIIDNCIANDNFINSAGPASVREALGLFVLFSTNVIISNSQINSNSAFNPAPLLTRTFGILTQDVANLIIENCQIASNSSFSTGSASSCFGILALTVENARIRRCTSSVNNAQGDSANIGGIQIEGSENITIEDCTVDGSTAAGSNSAGAGIAVVLVDGAVIKNCKCIGLTFINGFATFQSSAGIFSEDSEDVVIENCVALNNSAPANVLSNISGILVEGTGSRSILIKDCVASGQVAVNSSSVAGIRVFTSSAIDSKIVIEGSVAENNLNTANSSLGVGIEVMSIDGCTLFRNISKGNGIGIFVRSFVNSSTNCIVKENEASANSLFGFFDSNAVKNNAYLNNVAYNPAGTNYASLPANTPIRIWTIGAVPTPPVARDIDNLDLR